jgi:hypothetical protein
MHCGLGRLENINTLENECEKADMPGLKTSASRAAAGLGEISWRRLLPL